MVSLVLGLLASSPAWRACFFVSLCFSFVDSCCMFYRRYLPICPKPDLFNRARGFLVPGAAVDLFNGGSVEKRKPKVAPLGSHGKPLVGWYLPSFNLSLFKPFPSPGWNPFFQKKPESEDCSWCDVLSRLVRLPRFLRKPLHCKMQRMDAW